RIDQIWINQTTTWQSSKATIKDIINPLISRDHISMVTEIKVWNLNTRKRTTYHKPNHKYNWHLTSAKQWTKFSKEIEEGLTKQSIIQGTTDQKWNALCNHILKAAKSHISKRKHYRKKRIHLDIYKQKNPLIKLQMWKNQIRQIHGDNTLTVIKIPELIENYFPDL
ncbi:11478_t:CDS:1, partial [Acaulospora colombiana]